MDINDTITKELQKLQKSIDSGLTSVPISKFEEFRRNHKLTSACYKTPELHKQFLEIQKTVKRIQSSGTNPAKNFKVSEKDPTLDLIDEING